jgi:gliding motility-associated lipoprotein GldD
LSALLWISKYICRTMRFTILKITVIFFVLTSCFSEEKSEIPKPKGYYRITFPERSYKSYDDSCHFTFEYPQYSQIVFKGDNAKKCWPEIYFPQFKASLYLSYRPVNQDLSQLAEDSHTLTYKHTVRANGITEASLVLPEQKVFGTVYELGGNAASAIQFHLTDSTNHFLRGSLYFYASPNADSLQPVVDFLRADLDHFFKSFRWKN